MSARARAAKRFTARPPQGQPETGPAMRPPRWVDAAALGLLFLVLASWTWRKSGDVLVDFGHELYIPWQLSEGRVLYRDIAYFMGPLSQYANAALFRVFGASLTVLLLANLAVLAGLTAAIYALFSRALGRGAGVLVGAVFLCVFGFAHFVRLGNYNYVTPYLHEQSHGVALGVLLLVLLERAVRTPRAGRVAAAGAVLGLTFLTKAESFVPALAAALVAGGVAFVTRRPPRAAAVRAAAIFTGGALVPVALAFLFLRAQMDASAALRGLVGNWIYLFDRSLVLADPFYSQQLGLAGTREAVRDMAAALAWLGVFAIAAFGIDRALARRGRGHAAAAGVLIAVGLGVGTGYMTWIQVARPLPVVCLVSSAAYLWLCWRDRARPGLQERLVLALWSVFALASLGKMILRVRLEHYGFALAMPGTLLLVAVVAAAVPRMLQARGGGGETWRAAWLAAVAVATGWLLTLSSYHYRARTLPVAAGSDRMQTFDPRFHPSGLQFVRGLEALARARPADGSLVVLPDGVLLNYLLRRVNPTPYYLVTPWEMRAFGGEEAVLARIAPTAPDQVAIVRVDMSEFGGPRYFGDPGYGDRILAWVAQHYRPVSSVGPEVEGQPWMQVYERRRR